VESFYTAPGYKAYISFAMSVQVQEDQTIAISEGSFTKKTTGFGRSKTLNSAPFTRGRSEQCMPGKNFDLDCDHHNASPVIFHRRKTHDRVLSTPMVQFLYWHYMLNHISPRIMAKHQGPMICFLAYCCLFLFSV
jgi:hypothetical protein